MSDHCEDDKKRFKQALLGGSCDVVDSMLEAGYIPKTKCIITICEKGNLNLLTTLLRYFNLKFQDNVKFRKDLQDFKRDLQLGFLETVEYGHIHILDHLYLLGVDINEALDYVRDKHTCKWLLDMGACLLTDKEFSPLIRACTNGYTEVVELMIQYSKESLTKAPQAALHGACGSGSIKLVQLLIQYPEVMETTDNGDTFMHTCCARRTDLYDKVEIVKFLLEQPEGRESLSKTNNQGHTPIHKACQHGRRHIVKVLLQYPEGREAMTKFDNNGDNLLHMACRSGRHNLVRLLLQYPETQVMLFAYNNDDETPIDVKRLDNRILRLLQDYYKQLQVIQ